MMNSRFDAILKTLKAQSNFPENAVTEAAKLLEINYTMRQIDHEMERCKLAIIESLKGHEAAAQTLARLEDEREKIKISHEKLSDYTDNARPRMIEIEKTRNAFLMLLNNDKEDEEFDAQNARERREAIQEINDERLKVLDDLGSVVKNRKSLETELKDITTCIRLQKIENDALHATLEQKRTNIINVYQKLSARYNDLLKWKGRKDEKSAIKVEKRVTFRD